MDKLITGIVEFQKSRFVENQGLFKALAKGQAPETLFITCADSRIDPNLITQTLPGDLFICRNAGNIVPPLTMACTDGITASIEYAVSVLRVEHIVVCGHTDCGAMKGALYPDTVKNLPHMSRWLSNCAAALAKVKARHEELGEEHLLEMTQENILLQLKHLEAYPCVAAQLATGCMELHGWLYDIATGSVRCCDMNREVFIPLEEQYSKLLHRRSLRK